MRPFKDLKEFKEKTGKTIGSIIRIRYKENHDDIVTGIITGYDEKTFVLHVGGYRCCLWDMCEVHDYFDERSDKWLPFGVEETSTHPAKFQVGKEYFYRDKEGTVKKIFIHAKYKDPADSLIKVVFTNGVIRECYLDKDENEYITFYDYEIDAENAVKYEVVAKNVVKYKVNTKNVVKYEVNAKNEVKE